MVDRQELLKAVLSLHLKLGLSDKAKAATFCSLMADMIKKEPGHEE